MKKIALAAACAALSTTAFAGGSVGLGYETSTVDSNYGECWSECFGDQEPAGFALSASYDITSAFFVAADYADLTDEEDHYDWNIEGNQTRMALDVGYRHELNKDSNLTAAVRYADIEWSYDYTDPNPYSYEASDNGVSLVLGANTNVSDRVSTGAAVSFGFETGVEVYLAAKLSDTLGLKASLNNASYELGDFIYMSNGSPSTPSTANGDGDFEFDNSNLRVSLNYLF